MRTGILAWLPPFPKKKSQKLPWEGETFESASWGFGFTCYTSWGHEKMPTVLIYDIKCDPLKLRCMLVHVNHSNGIDEWRSALLNSPEAPAVSGRATYWLMNVSRSPHCWHRHTKRRSAEVKPYVAPPSCLLLTVKYLWVHHILIRKHLQDRTKYVLASCEDAKPASYFSQSTRAAQLHTCSVCRNLICIHTITILLKQQNFPFLSLSLSTC